MFLQEAFSSVFYMELGLGHITGDWVLAPNWPVRRRGRPITNCNHLPFSTSSTPLCTTICNTSSCPTVIKCLINDSTATFPDQELPMLSSVNLDCHNDCHELRFFCTVQNPYQIFVMVFVLVFVWKGVHPFWKNPQYVCFVNRGLPIIENSAPVQIKVIWWADVKDSDWLVWSLVR